MTSVLITGANRGIGLGFVRSFLEHPEPPALIIATCRDVNNAKELTDLEAANKSVRVVELDVSNLSSFDAFAQKVAALVGENGLNVLVNNAGILRKTSTLEEATPQNYIDTFNTNVFGPIFLSKALLPLIKKAAIKNKEKPLGIQRAAIVNVSSLVGSLQDNRSGGLYSYRESKAALNMFSVNLSQELRDSGILVVPVHPGWVKTDMGGGNAPVAVNQSATGLVDLLYKLDAEKNGKFFNFDGKILPW